MFHDLWFIKIDYIINATNYVIIRETGLLRVTRAVM